MAILTKIVTILCVFEHRPEIFNVLLMELLDEYSIFCS